MSSLCLLRPARHALPNLNKVPRRGEFTGVRRIFQGKNGFDPNDPLYKRLGATPAPSKGDTLDSRRQDPQPVSPAVFRGLMRQVPRSVVVVTSIDFPKTVAEEQHDGAAQAATAQTAASPAPDSPNQPEPIRHSAQPLPRAMTVSSFSSIALHPKPMVTFSIQRPSRCYDAIRRSGRFNIHVLRSSAAGAKLARYFSQPQHSASGDRDIGFSLPRLYRLTGTSVVGRPKWERTWEQMRGSSKVPDSPERTQKPMGTAGCVPLLQSDAVLYTLRCVVAPQLGSSPAATPGSGHIHLDHATILIGEVLDCQVGVKNTRQYNPNDIALTHAAQAYHTLGDRFTDVEIDRAATLAVRSVRDKSASVDHGAHDGKPVSEQSGA